MLHFDCLRYVATIFPDRVGQMKKFPAVGSLVGMKRIRTTMTKIFLAPVEGVITPHLGKVTILLDFDIPDLFEPDFIVRGTNSVQKVLQGVGSLTDN